MAVDKFSKCSGKCSDKCDSDCDDVSAEDREYFHKVMKRHNGDIYSYFREVADKIKAISAASNGVVGNKGSNKASDKRDKKGGKKTLSSDAVSQQKVLDGDVLRFVSTYLNLDCVDVGGEMLSMMRGIDLSLIDMNVLKSSLRGADIVMGGGNLLETFSTLCASFMFVGRGGSLDKAMKRAAEVGKDGDTEGALKCLHDVIFSVSEGCADVLMMLHVVLKDSMIRSSISTALCMDSILCQMIVPLSTGTGMSGQTVH